MNAVPIFISGTRPFAKAELWLSTGPPWPVGPLWARPSGLRTLLRNIFWRLRAKCRSTMAFRNLLWRGIYTAGGPREDARYRYCVCVCCLALLLCWFLRGFRLDIGRLGDDDRWMKCGWVLWQMVEVLRKFSDAIFGLNRMFSILLLKLWSMICKSKMNALIWWVKSLYDICCGLYWSLKQTSDYQIKLSYIKFDLRLVRRIGSTFTLSIWNQRF